jgi:hypothetical protein
MEFEFSRGEFLGIFRIKFLFKTWKGFFGKSKNIGIEKLLIKLTFSICILPKGNTLWISRKVLTQRFFSLLIHNFSWMNFLISDSPIIQMGFLMKRNRPQKPMYFDRQPADHSRMTYSTPKKTTKQISIQKSVSLAASAYCSIVDKTLNIKQTRTSINLQIGHELVIIFDWPWACHLRDYINMPAFGQRVIALLYVLSTKNQNEFSINYIFNSTLSTSVMQCGDCYDPSLLCHVRRSLSFTTTMIAIFWLKWVYFLLTAERFSWDVSALDRN